MNSPPRPVSVQDQQDWKIPPCISNWKNSKGHIIPLDKRLAADGRGLQEVQISDTFASLSEALYVAEEKARKVVELRCKMQKEIAMKEKEENEKKYLALATQALYESKQKRERKRRLEANNEAMGKKSKITRVKDRDISEMISLGMASVGVGRGENINDERLLNQEQGLASGFGEDDQYNLYDKALFTGKDTLSTLFKPTKDVDADIYGVADEQLEKINNTERFKSHRAFTGISVRAAPRDRPVEVDQVAPSGVADPFGLDQWRKPSEELLENLDFRCLHE